MGYWFPTFKVAGGLYAGQTPSGSLDSFIAHIQNFVAGASTIVGSNTIQYDSAHQQVIPDWVGAYGSDENAMRGYGDQHMGEGLIQDVPIFIFEIPKPENATFYKQELVIYGSVRCDERQSGDPIHQPDTWYKRHDYAFSVITRAVRREYATPYSEPVVTHTLFNGNAGEGGINYLIDGNAANAGMLATDFRTGVSYSTINDVNYLCFFLYVVTENEHGIYHQDTSSWESSYYYKYTLGGISYNSLASAFGGDFALDEDDDPNIDPDPDPDPGMDPPPAPGPRQPEYDPIEPPGLPELDAIGSGFLTLYSPSKTTLNLLADEIFSSNILDIIKNYFASIQEMIAGLSILPFFIPVSGFAHHKIGLFTSSVQLPLVRSQFYDLDCGTIDCKRYFNNFLDQSPNTKYIIWLPYIGYQSIDPDEVVGNLLNVRYHCDILSGACVAFLTIGGGGSGADATRVIAQYSGNVLTQVPTAAQAFNSQVSNAINILTTSIGVAAGAAIGGAAIGAAAGTSSTALVPVGAAGGAAASSALGASGMGAAEKAVMAGVIGSHANKGMSGTTANSVMGKKPTFSRNGTPGSTAGYMSVQKPYLIKIVPRDAVAKNHIQLNGYPSNFGGTLASLSGYCEVEEIQLNGVSATESEFKEIYNLLKGGVII